MTFLFHVVCGDGQYRHGSTRHELDARRRSWTAGCPFTPHRVVREIDFSPVPLADEAGDDTGGTLSPPVPTTPGVRHG